MATYNDFERKLAQFLDAAPSVLRLASLGTTKQGKSRTQFRVDYLKPSGPIGSYHPDWVMMQKTGQDEVNWVIETKGRLWEGAEAKDATMGDWRARASQQTDEELQNIQKSLDNQTDNAGQSLLLSFKKMKRRT